MSQTFSARISDPNFGTRCEAAIRVTAHDPARVAEVRFLAGRLTLAIDSGAAGIQVYPTWAEARALAKVLMDAANACEHLQGPGVGILKGSDDDAAEPAMKLANQHCIKGADCSILTGYCTGCCS